jgi:hypothetical protein
VGVGECNFLQLPFSEIGFFLFKNIEFLASQGNKILRRREEKRVILKAGMFCCVILQLEDFV